MPSHKAGWKEGYLEFGYKPLGNMRHVQNLLRLQRITPWLGGVSASTVFVKQ
jgi:hypothetical protein